MMKIKTAALILAVLLLMAFGVFYFVYYKNPPLTTKSGVSGTGEFEVSELPAPEFPAPPDLDRPLKITAELSLETAELAAAKIREISEKLKKNPGLYDHWLDLGIYRQMLGDYTGASQAWEYAAKISPEVSVAFNNLGELYAYYLKDNKKAEGNYLAAIQKEPNAIYLYRNLFDFYRNVLKDSAKAKAILEEGIAKNPDTSQDLQNLLKLLQ